MTKTLWLASTTIVAAAMMTAPAIAGGKTAAENRDQEIQELKARLDRLEREAEDEKIATGSRLNKVEETQNAVQWTFADGRPSIRSGDGRFEMAIRGRIHLDWALFDQDQADFGAGYGAVGSCAATNVLCDLGSGAVFRRLRFGIEGRFFRDFIYEMRFDFGGSGAEAGGVINIARVGYVGIPGLRIHAGAMQPIMTLYDATSSSDLTSMERAAVITTIVGPFGGDNARRGVEATYQEENFLYPGDNFVISGAFTGQRVGSAHAGGASLDDEGTQMLGRLVYRLWSDGVSNVQIGATGSRILSIQGTTPGLDRTLTFEERPEIRVSGDRFVSTGAIPATGGDLYGFEFGANFENIYLAAEYYKWSVDRDTSAVGGSDPDFSGWYVEGEWIFTGENKRYAAGATNNNVAVFRSPSVTSPWSPGGGTGAWSLTARYSTLNLNWNEGSAGVACTAFVQCIRGGEQNILNIGLNWYLNSNLKLQTEYAFVDVDRLSSAGTSLDAEFNVLQGRMQFTF